MRVPFLNSGTEFKLDEAALAKLEEEKELERLKQEAIAQIEADQADPTQQDYIQRLDTKTLVKDDQEFAYCLAHQIPMKRVGFTGALHVLAEEEAAKRAKIAKRKARKVTKASRKANRKVKHR